MESATSVIEMFQTFEKAYGQKVNEGKSSIFFSRNASAELKREICSKLSFAEADEKSTYLGLPSLITGKKSEMFGYIKHKLQGRIEGWDKKQLSRGAKEILIKTVGQTLPNYTMSVFLLPLELCKDLERIMCKYWWKSGGKKERGIHWIFWEGMCSRKAEGGMGFRNVRDFNIALLGKQAWRLLQFPDRLVSRVFKARYYHSSSFLEAQIGNNPSYIWRSIVAAQDMIKQGISCRIGSGESINIIKVPWLPSEIDPYVRTRSEAILNQKVSSLMVTGERRWDTELIADIFDQRDADLILAIPLNDQVNDNWYWRNYKLGAYTVKGGYLLFQSVKQRTRSDDNSGFWRKLWNLKIPPKVKNFLWRASNNCLPTKDRLRSKHVPVDGWCPLCNEYQETHLHAIVECSFAAQCWQTAALPNLAGTPQTFSDWLQLVFEQRNRAEIQETSMISWMIWKNRNEVIWNQKSLDFSGVVASALSVFNQWKFVQDKSFNNSMGFMTQEDGVEQWQTPAVNRVKINTDAAIFDSPNRYSYALVIRDHHGSLVEAKSKCQQGLVSPVLAEAMGIREVLSWVKAKHMNNVDVETDSLELVQWIRSPYTSLSYLRRIIDECRQLLVEAKDQNVRFNFIKRSANRVAHYLARYSYLTADRIWRIEDVHPAFYQVLCIDLKQ